ncbi:hypothetical protein [Nocardia sp. NPDC050435]|uniref:hypothetical protein n=1 Tax=Nocardia sp. NPDC050435 TaxID=3155040 RepID=UPI00340FFF89
MIRDRIYAVVGAVTALLVAMNVLPLDVESDVETVLNSVGGAVSAVALLIAKLNVSFSDRDLKR